MNLYIVVSDNNGDPASRIAFSSLWLEKAEKHAMELTKMSVYNSFFVQTIEIDDTDDEIINLIRH